MKNRIKEVRKTFKETQQSFGDKLNVSKSTIEAIEYGRREATDRIISDICRVYGINENWLRTGIGTMNVPKTRNQELADFFNMIMEDEPDSIRRIFIETFSKLPYEAWVVLDQLAESYVNNKKDR